MSFSLGVTFSNLQQKYGPPIYCAVAIRKQDYDKLNNVLNKDHFSDIFESKWFFLDFSDLDKEINRIMQFCKHVFIMKAPSNPRRLSNIRYYLDAFYETIQKLVSEDIRYSLNNLDQCFIRHPIDPLADFHPIPLAFHYLVHDINKYNPKFVQNNFDLSLEVARLFAWYQNLLNRSKNRYYLKSQFRYDKNHRYYKTSKINWNTAELSQYSSFFVGWPSVYYSDNEGSISEFFIEIGQKIDLLPICKTCQGISQNGKINRCIRSSDEADFGEIVEKNELCYYCNQASKFSICIMHPQCDGIEKICNDDSLISNICRADHCLYLTIFGNEIKIGRTRVNRAVSRLLEQSAYDALFFYPINGLVKASELEHKLFNILSTSKKDFSEDFKFKLSTTIKTRENHIITSLMSPHQLTRSDIYDEVLSTINQDKFFPKMDVKYINLFENWKIREGISPDSVHFSEIRNNIRLNGIVNGIVGSYILIDDTFYNFSKVGGMVFAL